ncbi:hypothetical protein DPX39_000016800 [Trypanosoma brucei equiperdum]|uniref:Uncharacterized protein n=1 Tax=Trypanosoma brucei equiperdum TaxID=630700 RepID=A0A3L6KS81_9TRYP|nr:hypothetical protein DPX39_000016800 [Trypanosoma brucei equiperdum]
MSYMIYDGAPTGGGVSAVRSTLRSAVKNSAVDAARDAVITTLNNALGSGCASAGVSSKEKTARLPNNRRQCQTAEANNNADDSPKPEGVSTERVGSTISMSGDIANVSDKEAGGVSALPDVSSSMRSHSKLSGTPSRFSAPRRRDLQHCVLNARDVGSSPFDYREKNQSAASPSVVFSCDGVLHDTKEENTGRNVSLQSAEAENRRPWVVDGGSPCSLRPGAGRSESLGSPALRTSSRFTPSVTGERPASSISCLRAVAARDAIASAARPSSSGSSRKLNLAQDTGNSEPFGPDFQGERLVYLGLYPDLGFGDGVNLRPPRLPAKRSTVSNAYNRSKQHQNKANSGLGGELGRQRVTLPPVAEVRSETSGLYEPHSEGSAFMSTQPGPGQLGRGEYLQPHPPPQRKRLSLSFSEHQREIVQGASRSLSPQQQVPNSWAPTLQSAMRAAPSGRMPSPVFTQQSYQDSTSTLTERDGWNRLSPGSPSHHSSSWGPPYSPTGSNALSTTVDSTSQTARRLGRIASRVANAHYHCTPVGPTPSRFSMTRVQPVASRVQVRSWVPSRHTPQENAIHLYNER